MRVRYIGSRNEYCYHGQRRAEIEGREGEQHKIDLMVDLMSEEFGYEFTTGMPEWASCAVSDRDEYDEFMERWKECKKILRDKEG